MTHLAIFASGRGSNAQKIIEHFQNDPKVKIRYIVSNKKNAPVLDIGKQFDINTLVINRVTFYKTEELLKIFEKASIDFIVLAGFLWLIPTYLVKAYHNRMVNIHPALLPKYGGKGMYGMNVHRAVHAAKEKETGITVHYVNEQYDEGHIIFQATCSIDMQDTPDTIAQKVRLLEHKHFPKIIENLIC